MVRFRVGGYIGVAALQREFGLRALEKNMTPTPHHSPSELRVPFSRSSKVHATDPNSRRMKSSIRLNSSVQSQLWEPSEPPRRDL